MLIPSTVLVLLTNPIPIVDAALSTPCSHKQNIFGIVSRSTTLPIRTSILMYACMRPIGYTACHLQPVLDNLNKTCKRPCSCARTCVQARSVFCGALLKAHTAKRGLLMSISNCNLSGLHLQGSLGWRGKSNVRCVKGVCVWVCFGESSLSSASVEHDLAWRLCLVGTDMHLSSDQG